MKSLIRFILVLTGIISNFVLAQETLDETLSEDAKRILFSLKDDRYLAETALKLMNGFPMMRCEPAMRRSCYSEFVPAYSDRNPTRFPIIKYDPSAPKAALIHEAIHYLIHSSESGSATDSALDEAKRLALREIKVIMFMIKHRSELGLTENDLVSLLSCSVGYLGRVKTRVQPVLTEAIDELKGAGCEKELQQPL